jgi:hypothetical protein
MPKVNRSKEGEAKREIRLNMTVNRAFGGNVNTSDISKC